MPKDALALSSGTKGTQQPNSDLVRKAITAFKDLNVCPSGTKLQPRDGGRFEDGTIRVSSPKLNPVDVPRLQKAFARQGISASYSSRPVGEENIITL